MGKRVLIIKMIEVRKGIYRMDGELEKVSDRSLVLVHPWYGEGRNLFELFNGEGSYAENLEKLLKQSSKRNLFLFEEDDLSTKSAKRIENFRGSAGFYIVPTKECNPTPSIASWREVAKVISRFGRIVDLAGGYLWRDFFRFRYNGCVGNSVSQLRRNLIWPRIIPNCCFK